MTSSLPRHLQKIIKAVDIVEKTLARSSIAFQFKTSKQKQSVTEENILEEDIFSTRAIILYLHELGNSYLQLLVHKKYFPKSCWDEFRSRSVEALEAALKLSCEELECNDTLHLLCVYGRCKVLCSIQDKVDDAKQLASTTFDAASSHTHSLVESAVNILQKIRDEFLLPDLNTLRRTKWIWRKRSLDNGILLDSSNPAQNQSLQVNPSSPPKHEEAVAKTTRAATQGPELTVSPTKAISKKQLQQMQKANAAVTHIHTEAEIYTSSGLALVRGLRHTVLLLQPILLEATVIPSSGPILTALQAIFRVYVRGNSLAAHVADGLTVSMDDRCFPAAEFLLQGPYLSWKGFAHFLQDFAVVVADGIPGGPHHFATQERSRPPHRNVTLHYAGAAGLGHTEPRGRWASPVDWDYEHDANADVNDDGAKSQSGVALLVEEMLEQPMSMRDAAAIFIEASRTAHPSLVQRKYLTRYEAIAAAQPDDPWRHVLKWVCDEEEDEEATKLAQGTSRYDDSDTPSRLKQKNPQEVWLSWDIKAGINYMQFIDAVAKCALRHYAGSHMSSALKTPQQKIEHFLTGQLGLTDSRKWMPRLEARQLKMVLIIQGLQQAAASATATTPTAAVTPTAAATAIADESIDIDKSK